MRKIKKAFTSILIFTFLYCGLAFTRLGEGSALRAPMQFNKANNEESLISKQTLDNITFLANKLPKEKAPDFVLSDGKIQILLSAHPDSNEVFKVYVRERDEWRKIRPLVQEINKTDANIQIDIDARGYLTLTALDLGKSPPQGVAKLVVQWLSYLAKAKGYKLYFYMTRHPRVLTLLSQVSDFEFNARFLYDKAFLVGVPGTPVKVKYKEAEFVGRGFMDKTSEEYIIEVDGKHESWIPEHEEDYPRDFEGWMVYNPLNKNRKGWYGVRYTGRDHVKHDYEQPPISLGKNGIIIDNKGEVIGQILAFSYSISAAGNPMPEKAGFINITIPDVSPLSGKTQIEFIKDRIASPTSTEL